MIEKLKKKVEKYKKRLGREKLKKQTTSSPSPNKKVKLVVGNEKVSPNVKKTVVCRLRFTKIVERNSKIFKTKDKRSTNCM